MALPKPTLDNRDFDQLVAEGRARLPRLAPAWTDYNTSDPGIILLELLSSRTEATSYRLDRTPPALLRNFLREVGVAPLAAQAADTELIVTATNAPFVLSSEIQFANAAGDIVFQTGEELAVSAAHLMRVLAAGIDVTAVNASGGAGFSPFGDDPKPGDMLELGFDGPLNVAGASFRLHAWTPTQDTDRDVRARLVAQATAINADQALVCPPGSPLATLDWRAHYGVATVWEYLRSDGTWSRLPGQVDATRAFSLTGAVEFNVPSDHVAGGPDPALHFIRCRVVSGTYECPPRLDRIAHNAVNARHGASLAMPEALPASAGHARERYTLQHSPIVPGSTTLDVTLPSGPDVAWHEVADWDQTGPHDRHYRLDATAGTIECGDGAVGRVFPAGAKLQLAYRVGSGPAGNVAAGTLVRAVASPRNDALYAAANGGAPPDWSQLALAQPYAAGGGVAAEPLNAAAARAVETAFAPSRAVTLDDYERLALAVPGVPAARARAIADYHPDVPCFVAAGSVTVVVVPACPDYRPVPSAAFLAAIARDLNRRRTVATEVHVAPPCYTIVRVSASLHFDSRTSAIAVRAAALAALERFFHPLRGGPGGTGWPIGRSVYRAEVIALLAGIDGVTAVTALGLSGEDEPEPRCGNFPICPDCLVRSGAHALVPLGPPSLQVIDRSTPHECP